MARFKQGDVVAARQIHSSVDRVPWVIVSVDNERYIYALVWQMGGYPHGCATNDIDKSFDLCTKASDIKLGKEVFTRVLSDILEK